MDYIEVEGKTYEEAIKKAADAFNVLEKDLEINVTEVDTKGILGLLGSKKVRITARLREKEEPVEPEPSQLVQDEEAVEGFGAEFLKTLAHHMGAALMVKASKKNDRLTFFVKTEEGMALIGRDGESLESVQYLLKLAIAKRFKQNLKITVDINGFREKRRKDLTIMAKRLADKARKTGRHQKTPPLNPYERRIIHTLFKHNKGVTTKSEGDGHTKQVIITPSGNVYGKR